MISENNSNGAQYADASIAHTKHTANLLNFPNVIGTGVGITKVGAVLTGEYCVKVFVATKVHKDILSPASILPRHIYVKEKVPVRVDVEQMDIPTVPLPV